MLFNSVDFLIFFPIVVLVYFIVPKKARYIWLLVASYYFYMCWNIKYIVLLVGSTLTTWLAGKVISASKKLLWKKIFFSNWIQKSFNIFNRNQIFEIINKD